MPTTRVTDGEAGSHRFCRLRSQIAGDQGTDRPDVLAQAATYLCCLFRGAPPQTFIELRWRVVGGMARGSSSRWTRLRACEVIVARGDETDVFVGVAPRVRRSGAAGDVERIHTGSLASPVAFATVSGGDESQQ